MDRNEQTEAVFKSSRTDVDPVSGNEVPPGATAEEVRDDIPAMLSENEYVVPADVVRYFGVRFFEDLRNKAKDGMVELEEGGRIGGEPIEDEGDDLPFDVSELTVIDEPDGEAEVGYYPGGLVIDPNVANMNTPDFLGGTSVFGGSGDEYKTFKNDAGLIMNVRFVNGKPMSYIPPGYKEQGVAAEEVAPEVTAPTTTQPVEAGGGREDLGRTAADDGLDATEAPPEAPSYGIGGRAASTALGAGLGALFGGPVSAVSGGIAGSQASAFNDARNDLANAIMSNDAEAISKAEKAVTETHGKLGLGAQIGVFGEGKTAKDAIANVMADVQNFLGVSAKGAKGTTSAKGTSVAGVSEGNVSESNIGDWGGDRDGDGIPNVFDFNDGVGWLDRGATEHAPNASPSAASPSSVSRSAVNAALNEAMGYSSVNPNTGKTSKDPNASFNAIGQVRGTGWSGINTPADTSPSNSATGGEDKGGYGCYVATALTESGYWSDIRRIKLIKHCMETKPEKAFLTKVWRNGYVVFGKKVIAPLTDRPVIKWLSDGYYSASVEGKRDSKSLLGLSFFAIPSYTIGFLKAVTRQLVDIDRT